MGGNALKNTKTSRLSQKEFFETQKKVIEKIKETFPFARVETIPAYSEKQTFGDLDILITSEDIRAYKQSHFKEEAINPLDELTHQLFNSTETFENNTVFSFDYREHAGTEYGFQVDLIYTQNDYFDFTKNYFSYNDLGNLIGRVAAGMGLKFGHLGLTYDVKDGNNHFAVLEISRDFNKSLEFLGFSSERYHRGFKNLSEIFEYIVNSKYYSHDLYTLEKSSYAERERERKRPTYRAFIQYSKKLSEIQKNTFFFPEKKKDWLPEIFKNFEGSEEAYNNAWNFKTNRENAKKIFNARNIGNITGLENKYLGHFMNHIRANFNNREMLFDWAIKSSEQEFKSAINIYLNQFNSYKDNINIYEPVAKLLQTPKLKIK